MNGRGLHDKQIAGLFAALGEQRLQRIVVRGAAIMDEVQAG